MFLFEKRVSDDYVDQLVRGRISVRVMIAITLPIAPAILSSTIQLPHFRNIRPDRMTLCASFLREARGWSHAVAQDRSADQKYPQREDNEAPAKIVAAEQK